MPGSRTSLPPGPPYPAAVSTLGWILRPMPFMERCRARYGDMFTLRILGEGVWVFLADPELVKAVFAADPKLVHAGEANKVLRPILGSNSVLLLDEAPHMRQRKLMLPSFHGERMQRYGALMADIAAREIAAWPADEPVAAAPRMQALTLEVILRAVFGVREHAQLGELRPALIALTDRTTDRRGMAWFVLLGPEHVHRHPVFRKARDRVDTLLYEEIRARRGAGDLAERDDVLSLLLQARHDDGTPMSDEELRDELMTLLVAGHETTATALSWALERLVRHPEVMARLREDIAVHGSEGPYLDAVAKETLRLRPVLPIVLRKLTAPMELGGYSLPAGVNVAPCIHLVHRREDVYPAPARFRPERFLEQPAGTYTWIPFGGGTRRCLGASFALFELKTVLATIVAKTRPRPVRQEPEGVTRRAITLVPDRRAEVVV